MAKKEPPKLLDIGGREVKISSPSKLYFPDDGITKLDVVNYFLAVGPGALRGVHNRPIVLERYVQGIKGERFYQKRAPKNTPDWFPTVRLRFPSGNSADELVVSELAQLIWMVNLGSFTLNPHPIRADDLDHPDELRIDLDPCPDVPWQQVQQVALVVREVLSEYGLESWPKTSGSRGIHILCRIERRWGFVEVRRAALAVAREVERRAPALATSKWWKEERHGVFLDYNQNAKDRTVAAAYSVRAKPGAPVSAPLTWEEVPRCQLSDFTVRTMPDRFAALGDLHTGIDDRNDSLESLLELSARHEAEGLGDAPWPPHFKKQVGEPDRVQPSKRKRASKKKKPTRKDPAQT